MITHIIMTIIGYFVLMYVSINLMGILVRGFFVDPEIDKLKTEGSDFIKKEVAKSQRADVGINIIVSVLIAVYLYLLFHFWNVGVMAVAIVFMFGRFQGLIWEIKNGKKTDTNLMPKNVLYYVSSFFVISAFPALYYFLYYF